MDLDFGLLRGGTWQAASEWTNAVIFDVRAHTDARS